MTTKARKVTETPVVGVDYAINHMMIDRAAWNKVAEAVTIELTAIGFDCGAWEDLDESKRQHYRSLAKGAINGFIKVAENYTTQQLTLRLQEGG